MFSLCTWKRCCSVTGSSDGPLILISCFSNTWTWIRFTHTSGLPLSLPGVSPMSSGMKRIIIIMMIKAMWRRPRLILQCCADAHLARGIKAVLVSAMLRSLRGLSTWVTAGRKWVDFTCIAAQGVAADAAPFGIGPLLSRRGSASELQSSAGLRRPSLTLHDLCESYSEARHSGRAASSVAAARRVGILVQQGERRAWDPWAVLPLQLQSSCSSTGMRNR